MNYRQHIVMIIELLKILGFNESEIKIYLSLLEGPKGTAAQIARRVEIPRTTAYSVLENLVDKGVVKVQREASATSYAANNPESIKGLVRREREAVLEKELIAEQVVNMVNPYFGTGAVHIPKMEFYEGQTKVETMLYNNLPDWEASLAASDVTIWGYQDPSFVKYYPAWLEYHWKRKDDLIPDLKICLFSNEVELDTALKDKANNRFIRHFPGKIPFSSSVWLMGDYVVMFRTDKDPHYAFQLKDNAFAENMKIFVKFLWEST